MEIREATSADIPRIVNLLKLSLGEKLLPKSESFWKWKHVNNPFGSSLVIVAEQNGELIGVRAFLKWEWNDSSKTWRALRAVDTAVHPDHQGKGIFTKLTTTLFERAKSEGYDFIFNTPNKKSLPGYLKMGWQKLGHPSVQVQINFNFKNTEKKVGDKKESRSYLLERQEIQKVLRNIDFKTDRIQQDLIMKNVDSAYLEWRYMNCPLYHYQFLTDDKTFLLIYRIKETAFGRELRIAELLPFRGSFPMDQKEVLKQLRHIQQESGIRFTSILKSKFIKLHGFLTLPSIPIIPLITIKNLLTEPKEPKFMIIKNWEFAMGDLELF